MGRSIAASLLAASLAGALTACTGFDLEMGTPRSSVATTLSLAASAPSVSAGSPVTLTATVSPGAARGTVTFLDGVTLLGTATLSSGTASLSTSALSAGTHALSATYEGSSPHTASTSAVVAVTVSEASGTTPTTITLSSSIATVTVGGSLTLSATVSPSAATGSVTFLDGTATLGAASLSSGTAILTTSALAIGTHTLTAAYGGSSTHAASASAAVAVTVSGASSTTPTTTTLSRSAATVTAGGSVTLTAAVSPSAATGSVTFLDGTTALGTGTLSSGSATLVTSSLAVGTHSLTAAYEGSSSHAASASSAVAVTVTAGGTTASTTTLQVMKFSASGSSWSTSASAPLKGKVVLAATTSPTAATGTVTFLDGTSSLGSTPLHNGRAVFITSALAAGAHGVTAVYGGSSTYAGSSSSAVAVTVAGAPVDCTAITGDTSFSFFVTSYAALQKLSGSTKGFGGNLRFPNRTDTSASAGLAGADTLCAVIADMVEEGSSSCKTWRAFLSTAGKAVAGVSSTAVSARDRVGSGPWHDIQGRRFARSPADFPSERPANCDSAICNDFPNETGTLNHAPDGMQIDNHDTLTGSNESGQLFSSTATCFDWTSDADTSGYRPQCGHSWPRGGGGFGGGNAWISAHNANGCLPGVNFANDGGGSPDDHSVGSGGGYGGFFCFAQR